ncbi:MAG: transcription termination factor NusA [Oscillospiraceae bacterium]|jgi:N utilization substance protein A|nr:transcription termination factor NusA [Oscillospiraceae bacterium]
MNAEFFMAIEDIEREKGISQTYMVERIEQALLAALRKDFPGAVESAHVELNPKKRTIEMYVERRVVAEPENPDLEITLEEAREINKRYKIGDIVREEIDARKFGRIAAQAAKQVIVQGIREAERNMVYDEFTSKEHEILTGIVTHVEAKTGAVSMQIASNTEYTEAVMPYTECIPGERVGEGERLKVYIVEVRRATRGPQVTISRTHPGLVKRLFELEVPEIAGGIVEIKSVAREAGSRTKLAVRSSDPVVEPIGACVGPRGARVNAVVEELGGEKIDIVKYSDIVEEYISSALAPSDVVKVTLLSDGKSCRVIVPDSQLSLAIGKEGQNVRLAARLTGYKIDIKPQSQYM